MEHEFSQFVNYFKGNLKELKMCGEKVVELSAQTKTTLLSFKEKVEFAAGEIEKLFSGFQIDDKAISLGSVNEQMIKAELLRQNCPLFCIEALGGTDKSEMGILRTNVSKLNLLLEASLKIKLLTENRMPKVLQKFPEEDASELNKIAAAISIVADSINKEVSTLNAQVAFLLAKEMEINSKIQTFETVVGQLQKRFANIG